jgi:hypothetical protein
VFKLKTHVRNALGLCNRFFKLDSLVSSLAFLRTQAIDGLSVVDVGGLAKTFKTGQGQTLYKDGNVYSCMQCFCHLKGLELSGVLQKTLIWIGNYHSGG